MNTAALKQAAHAAVTAAVADGRLVRPEHCSSCGAHRPPARTASGAVRARIEAHHPDHRRQLDVVWLCKGCHVAIHTAEGAYVHEGRSEQQKARWTPALRKSWSKWLRRRRERRAVPVLDEKPSGAAA